MSHDPTAPPNPYASPGYIKMPAKPKPGLHGGAPLARYQTVRRGLQFIYYAIVTSILFFIALIGVGTVSAFVAFGEIGVLAKLGVLGVVGLFLACGFCVVTGFFMCLWAPEPNEKSKSLTFVALHVLSFLISLIGALTMGVMVNAEPTIITARLILNLVTNLMVFAANIFFILFIMQIGKNIKSAALVGSAKSAMKWLIAIVVGMVLLIASTSVALMLGPANVDGTFLLTAGASIVLLIVGLGAFFKIMAMIRAGITHLTLRAG